MFFLPPQTAIVSAVHFGLIKKITLLRVAGYREDLLAEIFIDAAYSLLPELIKELAFKILKANLFDLAEVSALKRAQTRLSDIIDHLKERNEPEFVFFSSQLIQFYTIICDQQWISQPTTQLFQQFLCNNQDKFGVTEDNLLIAEYKIMILYNEAVTLLDSSEVLDQVFVDRLGQHLLTVKQCVEKHRHYGSNNLFIHYLLFIIDYTKAKLLELQLKHSYPSDVLCFFLIQKQETYLKSAQDRLDCIVSLVQAPGGSLCSGLEFNLGADLFSKFPIKKLQEIKKHIDTLLSVDS